MNVENWLPVVGYEGIYEVSDQGRVRRIVDCDNGYKTGRALKIIKDKAGYLRFCLCRNGTERKFLIHRLVAFAFLGKPPVDKQQINHKNGIKMDNRVENLEWVSPGENRRHAYKTGLQVAPHGEQHYNTKLAAADVLAIRASKGVTQKELAVKYGISHGAVSMIISHKRWACIPAIE